LVRSFNGVKSRVGPLSPASSSEWFGGTRGGIKGRREWMIFALMLSAILVLAIGLESCAYAVALYG
jgi:hypothetical protein